MKKAPLILFFIIVSVAFAVLAHILWNEGTNESFLYLASSGALGFCIVCAVAAGSLMTRSDDRYTTQFRPHRPCRSKRKDMHPDRAKLS